ncbi:MAG: ATP-binding cassette domain-containing protein [Gammaproteobacteria bacterium]|nr:ATP-binding cassette domain-containing protein [Gammaproteobacteria bacterium]
MQTLLYTRNLGKTVHTSDGPLCLLQDINIELARGERVGLVGASGSGKTTLLSLLAALDTPSEGEIVLAGHNLGSLSEDQRTALRAQMIGFVFQSFLLLPGLTAQENVELPLRLAGAANPAVRARELLTMVGLARRLHHYPAQLSGGEQQRVAIARAFALNPPLLLADEPTGNLDQTTGAHIIELLLTLNREHGTTLLLVTHDPSLAARCDRLLRLDQGRLRAA